MVPRFQLVSWFCYSKSQSSYISPFTSTFPHCRLNVASGSHGCNCCCYTVWRMVTAVLCVCCHNPHAPHLCLSSSHTPKSTQWDTTMAFLMRREAYDVLHTSCFPPTPWLYSSNMQHVRQRLHLWLTCACPHPWNTVDWYCTPPHSILHTQLTNITEGDRGGPPRFEVQDATCVL